MQAVSGRDVTTKRGSILEEALQKFRRLSPTSTMMRSTTASMMFILLALPVVTVLSFSTTPLAVSLRPIRASSRWARHIDKSPHPLFLVATNGEAQDSVLREIEKKQAELTKKKEEAIAKLNQVEEIFQKLETKKQQYLAGAQLEQKPGGSFTETAVRSAVKAFLWRIIAGSVTFYTSLKFSGSVTTALSIVGSDFFSKSFTMFIGERLMNKSQAGRKGGADDVGRSLAKALVWRVFALANTLTMAIFIAKDLSIASKIAGSDAIVKTTLMFFYERVWADVTWGKNYLIEFSI